MQTINAKKESASLRFLYHTTVGRLLLKPLVAPPISRLVGAFMSSSLSRPLIGRFVKKTGIRLSDYEDARYRSFNDCFTRKIKSENRPIPEEKDAFISPCDAYLSAYPIDGESVFHVKGSDYSVAGLLGGNEALAKSYDGGTALIFRLCVHHYHRYIYLDAGKKGENVFIKGKLHTVRPIALETFPVFVQNTREYTVLDTEGFGAVTQIEVGALLVGKIQNHHGAHTFVRGEEKGTFLYGGSTVILLVPKGAVCFDERLFRATEANEETEVQMGEVLGKRCP